MRLGSDYSFLREGKWNLFVLNERWSQGLWTEVMSYLRAEPPAAHPQTRRFRYPAEGAGEDFYLKIYYRSNIFGSLKDLLRDSKAFRALRQGVALAQEGFQVPLTVAAGEERSFRSLEKAFLLTLGIRGSSLPLFIRERHLLPMEQSAVRKKREHLKQLALEIRRLHRLGFVHGDLVPTNILVRSEENGVTFFYMDHDRTRRYPRWLPHRLWRRNLVQLNRFVLPGIFLQDRMRFLNFYLGDRPWAKGEQRLVRWLEKKTRKRRRECDQVEAPVSFRELMRWNGPFAKDFR